MQLPVLNCPQVLDTLARVPLRPSPQAHHQASARTKVQEDSDLAWSKNPDFCRALGMGEHVDIQWRSLPSCRCERLIHTHRLGTRDCLRIAATVSPACFSAFSCILTLPGALNGFSNRETRFDISALGSLQQIYKPLRWYCKTRLAGTLAGSLQEL